MPADERAAPTACDSITNLIVRRRYGDGPTVALNAHGDVVPPGEGWTHDPYGGEVVDGKLYGRAAGGQQERLRDLHLRAARARVAAARRCKGGVELHFTYDEEFGGELGPGWLLRAGLTKPDLLLAAGFSYQVVTAHNGCLQMEVTVHGKMAHAAIPDTGVDALQGAVAILNALYAQNALLPRSVTSKVPGITHPYLNVGRIEGGTNTNVVPGKVVLQARPPHDPRGGPGRAVEADGARRDRRRRGRAARHPRRDQAPAARAAAAAAGRQRGRSSRRCSNTARRCSASRSRPRARRSTPTCASSGEPACRRRSTAPGRARCSSRTPSAPTSTSCSPDLRRDAGMVARTLLDLQRADRQAVASGVRRKRQSRARTSERHWAKPGTRIIAAMRACRPGIDPAVLRYRCRAWAARRRRKLWRQPVGSAPGRTATRRSALRVGAALPWRRFVSADSRFLRGTGFEREQEACGAAPQVAQRQIRLRLIREPRAADADRAA